MQALGRWTGPWIAALVLLALAGAPRAARALTLDALASGGSF
jgi:hypothetical protein